MDSPQKAFNNINKMSDGIKDNTVKDKKDYFEEVSFDDKYGIVETKKVKSIYSYFNKYSRAKINIGIGRLDLLDQFYLYFRYGGKLDIPDAFALTMNQKEYFDNNIIPKLSEILKNINKESNNIPSDVMFLSNETFTKDDLNKMRLLLDKYKKSEINYYLSINQFFIKVLREGYINDKVYTKEDIMSILHLDSIEYDYCLSDVKEIYEDKKTRENIINTLKIQPNEFINEYKNAVAIMLNIYGIEMNTTEYIDFDEFAINKLPNGIILNVFSDLVKNNIETLTKYINNIDKLKALLNSNNLISYFVFKY